MERFHWNKKGMVQQTTGYYVAFSEAQAEIARLQTELKESRQGFVDGIYLSACYCSGDHTCSPCQIKLKAVRLKTLEEAANLVDKCALKAGSVAAIAESYVLSIIADRIRELAKVTP